MGEPSSITEPSRPAPGTILGERYLIERLINEGGMGAIYGARDLLRDQPVAVKLILQVFDSHAACPFCASRARRRASCCFALRY